MPHLRFSGLNTDSVQNISKPLVDDLAKLLDCPRDYFTLELLSMEFIFDGRLGGNRYPMVDVSWFDRGQTIQNQAAGIITHTIRSELGNNDELDICVRFSTFDPKRYYENGEHF
ncbi:MAG: DUF1904 family protein [Endozoicomonas sp.]|uniref:DUF1904 family protein n=1 Tax=Endozoicomonas sp. TaxID=1892382 RepID=UPI003D9B43A2